MSAPPSPSTVPSTRPALVRVLDLAPGLGADLGAGGELATAAPGPVLLRLPGPRVGRDEATTLVRTVVRPLLEVLEGRRPLRQLTGVLSPVVLHRVETILDGRLPGDLRLHTIRVDQPRPDVIEASVTVQAGVRFRAVALRLQRRGRGRWTCTALRLG